MSNFPHFRETLLRNPEAGIELVDETRRRYLDGQFPSMVRWLIRHPQLLEALAADAHDLRRKTSPGDFTPALITE
jgi:hypothetical protein